LIELDSSEASSPQESHLQSPTGSHAPSQAPGPTPKGSSGNSTSHTPQGSSPRASDNQLPGDASSAADDAQASGSSEPADDAVSALTTRSSGSQYGMQLPSVKAQKGSNMKGAASGDLGPMGRRKGSGRAAARQTSEELPDVTGRQSDHTIFDATGIRRVSTAGRRIFGSSA